MSRMTKTILTTLPSITAVTCLGLAGWIWLPFEDGQTITPQTNVTSPVPTNQTADLIESGAQQLTERPLFHISRRPPAEEEVVEPAPVQVTLSLTGVLDSDDVQIALLRLSNSPELLRRRVGETVGDWRITAITNSSITVVTRDGQEQIIGLSPTNP